MINEAAKLAASYIAQVADRPVAPTTAAVAALEALRRELADEPMDPVTVLRLLDAHGSPATVASAGPRYFGFVAGGALPAALGARVLAAAWDQNTALEVMSPTGATLEATAAVWILELLGLPRDSGVGFTTGASMANLTALAAARHELLAKAGWNVEDDGLYGAPIVSIIVGDEVHVTVLKALSLLGFGRTRITRVPVDNQGRMRADVFPRIQGPTIVCLQAGNVNTGAFDPFGTIIDRAHDAGAWVHVDGAFGLWALASPQFRQLAQHANRADSWATDAHKWLNVPYDSGIAIVRDAKSLRAAMSARAAYLAHSDQRDGANFTPEFSRQARGVETWAALKSLGRRGVADLVERCSRLASRFADGARRAGLKILNDVVLNQVLVAFGDAKRTRDVIAAIQSEGTCWCGGTTWQGRPAMRFSVCSWATTEADIDRSLEAVVRVAATKRP